MPSVTVPFPAPEFSDPSLRWVQGGPSTLRSYRGQVVLIDFFDVSCVHCLRALPYLQTWHDRYSRAGLVLVGIHAAEFEFGRDSDLVAQELRRLNIRWPVALDPDLVVWQRFGNRAWPGRFLVDHRGRLRFHQFGEGGYGELELSMQQLLVEGRPSVALPDPLKPLRPSDDPYAECLPVTPELYLGSLRGRWLFDDVIEEDAQPRFHLPTSRGDGGPTLEGPWRIHPEFLEFGGPTGESGWLRLAYVAQEVHAVMAPGRSGRAVVWLRVDGEGMPVELRGLDVTEGDAAKVEVDRPRLYSLIIHPAVESHRLELRVESVGWRGYSLAFVTGTALGVH